MKKALFLTLVLVLVMSTTAAFGDTIIGTDPDLDGKLSADHNVVVNANVNPRLELTIADADHIKNVTVDPGGTTTADVAINAKSNRLSALSRAFLPGAEFNGAAQPTLAWAWVGPDGAVAAIGDRNYTDQYTIGAGWDVDSSLVYTGTVVYTLVEQ